MSTSLLFTAHSEADTNRLGALLAAGLPERALVLLNGTLGSGKTRLVQAVAEACGVDRRDVTSPTYVLLHEYTGARTIYHCDAYRIRDNDEFLELGIEELLVRPGVMFIEWAARVQGCLPQEHLAIQIEVISETERRFLLTTNAKDYDPLLAAIAKT